MQAFNKRISLKEIFLILFVVILVSFYTGSLRTGSPLHHMGDSGQNYKVLYNIYEEGYPLNDLWPSLYKYVFEDKISANHDIDFYENDFKINYEEIDKRKFNHFYFHAYFVTYLLSFFLLFLEASFALNFLNCLSFFSLLGCSYLLLRKNNFNYYESIAIVVGLSMYPGWTQSFFGQPFFDSLFRIGSFITLYLLFYVIYDVKQEKKVSSITQWKNISFLVISTLFCISIVEKVSFYLFLTLLVFLVFYYKNINTRYKYTLLILSFLSIFYFIIISKLVLINPYYESSAKISIDTFINFFNNPFMLQQTGFFLIALLPFLLIIMFGRIRNAIFFLIILSPNIFHTIGGAEKTGFYTHYHSLYLGFLFFFVVEALSDLRKKRFLNKLRTILLILVVIFYYLFVNVTSLGVELKFNRQNFFNQLSKVFVTRNINYEIEKSIYSILPDRNSKIVVTEKPMPHLYTYKNLTFFPYNLEESDYIIFNYSFVSDEKLPYLLLPHKNYDDQIEIREILLNKIKKFYDYDKPLYDQHNLLILKKIN
ncbi:hypothetical protein N9J93_00390 [Methylophilaceae bacterium]|nr:hypothetical protein [Methylophilaceae bacterium]